MDGNTFRQSYTKNQRLGKKQSEMSKVQVKYYGSEEKGDSRIGEL